MTIQLVAILKINIKTFINKCLSKMDMLGQNCVELVPYKNVINISSLNTCFIKCSKIKINQDVNVALEKMIFLMYLTIGT